MRVSIVLLLSTMFLAGNARYNEGGGRSFEIKIHNINQVEMCISNFGKFGQTATGDAGCWWPVGSNHNYIFGAGIWFGTVDSATGDTLVTIGYGPHGGEAEFVPGLDGMPPTHPDAIIFMYPENWPPPDTALPMAPQDTVSHQDSWCCMNDLDTNAHIPGDTRPIGLEMYQTGYPWDDGLIKDVIFMTYEIKNVSGHNLEDCYIGICMDNDVGNEAGPGADDQCTIILEQPYFIDGNVYVIDNFAYQWDGDDYEPGWSSVGAIGVDLLQTPFDLEIGQDKDHDGIPDQYERDSSYYWNNVPMQRWDIDNDGVPDWRDASENPQLGMTAFKIFSLNFEPNIDAERYMTLAGYNFQNGQYEPYDTIIPLPDDQRFLMSSGPFDLEIDSALTFVFAVVLADFGADASPSAETCLVINDHWAQWQYDMNWFLYVEEETAREFYETNLILAPNPTSRNAHIAFTTLQSGLISVRLYNAAGQLVKKIHEGVKPAGKHVIPLSTRDLSQGTYFLVVETPDCRGSRSLVILR